MKKKVISKINEKGYRNKPLTDEQKANNKEKPQTLARVEHVLISLNIGCTSTNTKQVWLCIRFAQYFVFMVQSMNGLFVRSFGIFRATGIIGLINLTYSFFRYEQVLRLNILQKKIIFGYHFKMIVLYSG